MAVTNMEIALRLAPNNADFKAKLEEYSTYVPLDLTVEQNILSNSKSCSRFDILEANNGTAYHNVIQINDGEVLYSLTGKYHKLTGTIFVSADDKI